MVSEWHMEFGPAWPWAHRVNVTGECPHDHIVVGATATVCLRCGDDSFPREGDPLASDLP